MSNPLFDCVASSFQAGRDVFLETADGSTLTYAQLLAQSGRYAHALVAAGVQVGDRVAVQVEKSAAVIVLYLACARAGAVFLPLNTAYTVSEVDYFVGDARPALLVCDPSRAGLLAEVAQRHGARLLTQGVGGNAMGEDGSLHALAMSQEADFATVPRGTDDLAAILYTSGTTGRSKGAMLTHGNLVSNSRTLCEIWRFSRSDVLIHALPVYHTHGLFVATNCVLFSGAKMLFFTKFDAKAVLAAMARASVLMGVPTFYTRLLDEAGLTAQAAATMRLFVSGSAPLLAETHREWQARTGHAILERYGMTETNMNTSNPYDGARIAGTVGLPLPGVALRVVAPESGAALGVDEIGMIEVKGPNVFLGYWQMPEKTKAEFRPDGFFITGDLGKVDAQGYVHIVGRGKDLIISGGFNVYPKEIEGEIDAIAGVVESAVIGVPHRDFGEAVVAVVVREKGVSLDEAAIVAALHGRLARFKQPKQVFFVDELPRNAMGKVQKAVLRAQYGPQSAQARPSA